MYHEKRLQASLFLLRLSVFVVMLMWTIDKFIRPDHASLVFAQFYHIVNVTHLFMYILAAIELLILIAFLFGIYKTVSYGLVLIFHLISTVSSYQQYFAPYVGVNLLFYAAWPMLAACIALWLLRDLDTVMTFQKRHYFHH